MLWKVAHEQKAVCVVELLSRGSSVCEAQQVKERQAAGHMTPIDQGWFCGRLFSCGLWLWFDISEVFTLERAFPSPRFSFPVHAQTRAFLFPRTPTPTCKSSNNPPKAMAASILGKRHRQSTLAEGTNGR